MGWKGTPCLWLEFWHFEPQPDLGGTRTVQAGEHRNGMAGRESFRIASPQLWPEWKVCWLNSVIWLSINNDPKWRAPWALKDDSKLLSLWAGMPLKVSFLKFTADRCQRRGAFLGQILSSDESSLEGWWVIHQGRRSSSAQLNLEASPPTSV